MYSVWSPNSGHVSPIKLSVIHLHYTELWILLSQYCLQGSFANTLLKPTHFLIYGSKLLHNFIFIAKVTVSNQQSTATCLSEAYFSLVQSATY
jgi:hypothetical protein